MEKEDRKKRRQAMEVLDSACKQFRVEHDLRSLDEEMIEQFLAQTADIELDQTTRLLCFAGRCPSISGWKQTGKVYRYIIDVLNEDCPTYALWIATGVAMMSKKDEDLDHRKHIAEDVENLIREASKVNTLWEAPFWGEFYIKHPLRDDNDPIWLQQAEKWLEISLEGLRVTGECGPHELCGLADVYRGLGKLPDAARLYREALAHNSKGCCEETLPDDIQAKLAMCDGIDAL